MVAFIRAAKIRKKAESRAHRAESLAYCAKGMT
jgi:hypothetical protein